MSEHISNDPLHGVTLEYIIKNLLEYYGWEELGRLIPIRCFDTDPSISSSLKFLRKTPWARTKVERLYLSTLKRETEDQEEKLGGKEPAAEDS